MRITPLNAPTHQTLTIGLLADAVGVNVETIRYYQRRGLLAAPDRPHRGIRRYGTADLNRLRFIKSAQGLGFSLDEVAELLTLEDGQRCAPARELAERKLAQVRDRLKELRRMERALKEHVKHCANARGKVCCPLVEALHAG